MHRNSQKRFYDKNYIYFITTNTDQRLPFFKEDIFCELFIENLQVCKKLKEFELYAFIIIPDHVHLLINPGEKFNISEIMFSIKKQFLHNVNRVIGENKLYLEYKINEGEQTFARLRCCDEINEHQNYVNDLRKKFVKKYGHPQHDIPDFKWQHSFHDHVIRNEKDFNHHYNYIIFNCIKHGICEDEEEFKWSSLNEEFADLIDD